MMPTSGIVPIPCADAAEGVVQLPAQSLPTCLPWEMHRWFMDWCKMLT